MPLAARQRSWKELASTIKPGVQKPHCNASCAMKAFWTGWSPLVPTPSTVITALPAAARAGNRQLTIGAPSSSTVQAPQTPDAHTSFVPVRPSPPRMTSISKASPSSGSGADRPLIVMVLIFDLQVFAASGFWTEGVLWPWLKAPPRSVRTMILRSRSKASGPLERPCRPHGSLRGRGMPSA